MALPGQDPSVCAEGAQTSRPPVTLTMQLLLPALAGRLQEGEGHPSHGTRPLSGLPGKCPRVRKRAAHRCFPTCPPSRLGFFFFFFTKRVTRER